ncbi:MAG: hypothetical protein JW795_06295 [Chitinivibrionales bacterium]|nr:hypothetical protein [Chitinivibrionales bacterium]
METKITVGKYQAQCDCSRTFLSRVDIVEANARYSNGIRQLVADSLIRDRLPYRLVQERMREDFYVWVSLGSIHECFYWAHEQINSAERQKWIVEHFSGVLCIDEVHERGRVILYATDPISDFTVDFAVNEKL